MKGRNTWKNKIEKKTTASKGSLSLNFHDVCNDSDHDINNNNNICEEGSLFDFQTPVSTVQSISLEKH